MNTRRTAREWNAIAVHLGYDSMLDLLDDLYLTRAWSCQRIAALLDCHKDRVNQLLRVHGLALRPRGGARR